MASGRAVASWRYTSSTFASYGTRILLRIGQQILCARLLATESQHRSRSPVLSCHLEMLPGTSYNFMYASCTSYRWPITPIAAFSRFQPSLRLCSMGFPVCEFQLRRIFRLSHVGHLDSRDYAVRRLSRDARLCARSRGRC